MTVRQRILSIKVSEKIKKAPDYAKKIGIKNAEENYDTNKSKKNQS